MSADRDYYELLGIGPNAPEAEIRRAYREKTVVRHRRGVIKLEADLEQMHDAFRVLTDKAQRARYDAHRVESRAAFNEPSPREDAQRRRRDGRRLRGIWKAIARDTRRRSEERVATHADAMQSLGEEQDAIERAEARARRRQAIAGFVVRAVVLALALVGAALLWTRG
jgi:DnaJ-class molecular chaperone